MILFCGIESEPPLRLCIEAAQRTRVPFALFNQRESQFYDIALDLTATGRLGGTLRLRETDFQLESFCAVYTRLMDWRYLPENLPSRNRQPRQRLVEKSRLVHELLNEWMELTQCLVLNKTSAMGSNMSKPYQAQLITECGFRTPQTLITNDPSEVRAFAGEHGRVVYKSISSVRSVVRELGPEELPKLNRVEDLPTQFQAFVPGTNIRVHVVGTSLFATRIETEAVDYRYAGRDGLTVSMRAVELPRELGLLCLKLSERLSLPLCGIDLKRTPGGDYYCFEVNPSPAYSYYEEQTGQPISQAIVDYLAGSSAGRKLA